MKKSVWKKPPVIKIYEALGALADKRLRKNQDDKEKKVWRIYSSLGNKFYLVKYDEKNNAIMSNDNGSYWQGYLGYPAIAILMLNGKIKYQPKFAKALKRIKWKDLNTKFKNDYTKTIEYCHQLIQKRGYDLSEFLSEIENINKQIQALKIKKLGKRLRPPQGY